MEEMYICKDKGESVLHELGKHNKSQISTRQMISGCASGDLESVHIKLYQKESD